MHDPCAEVKTHFADVEGVTVNSGRGSQGMKAGKEMFAMLYKGGLLLKLAPERVTELIASGEGLPFDPGTGTRMADHILVPESRSKHWISLSEESLRYEETRS